MKVKELAELVKQMRDAQRDYFREQSRQDLSRAKELERRVDAAVEKVLDAQKELF